MPVSRIDLADAGSPNKLMMAFLKAETNLSIPVQVEHYCYLFGILEIKPLDTAGFEGGLITTAEKNEGYILIRNGLIEERRRFTIAHELGHFLIPTHIPSTDSRFLCSKEDFRRSELKAEDRRIRMESEANQFAALFLMPPPYFRKDIAGHSRASLEGIFSVATRYETSKEATARNYINYREEPCAVVVAHQDRILRYYKNSKFPFIVPKIGDSLPKELSRHIANCIDGTPSDVQKADTADWIELTRGTRAPEMWMQYLKQRQGFSMTLLTMQYHDEDEDYEEEQIARNWRQPGFGRR